MAGLFTVLAQLFIDGGWSDVVTSVRSNPHISVERGASGWLARSSPAKVTATLTNEAGRFSPRNPGSDLYGKIGRNTRMRVAVQPNLATGAHANASDTFTRTVANSWGTADSGQAWSQSGSISTVAADFNVAAGVGTHSVSAAGGFRFTYLNDISTTDVSIAVTFTCPQATGASLEPGNFVLRGTSLNDYMTVRVGVTTTNTVTLQVYAKDFTILGTATVAGLTHTGTGQPLRVRAYATGQQIFARVWIAANPEPSTWDLSVVNQLQETFPGTAGDSSPEPGFLGVRSGRAVGNTNASPVAFSYDDFEATPEWPRAVVEVPRWPQDWNHKGTDVRCAIEGQGPLARAQASTKPVRSAMTRAMRRAIDLDEGPAMYWPLEDGPRSPGAQPMTADTPPLVFTDAAELGMQEDVNIGSLPYARVGGTNRVAFNPIHLPAFAGYFAYSVMFTGTLGPGDLPLTYEPIFITFTNGDEIDAFASAEYQADGTFNPSTTGIVVNMPGGGLIRTPIGAGFFNPFDGLPHTLAIQMTQSGGNLVQFLFVDGQLVDSDSVAGTMGTDATMYGPLSTTWALGDTVGSFWGFGHLAIHTESNLITLAGYHDAASGFDGETATTRLLRLCTEEGYGFQLPGDDLDSGELMGPQRPGKFADLLDECRAADRGYLYEARDSFALAYRTRSSLYNQTTAFGADYDAAHFIDAPRPDNTFEIIANRVVATRPGGQTYTIEDATGPLGTADPPDGAGLHEVGPDFVVATDERLAAVAQWVLALGTVDEEHFPSLKVELASAAFVASPALTAAAANIDIADALSVDNLPTWVGALERRLLALGSIENVWERLWSIDFTTAPAEAYYVWILGDPATGKLDARASALTVAISAVATSLSVSSTGALWTVDAVDITGVDGPLKIVVGGEIMTVTAISGASSPQTFTVTRGSPAYAWPIGASVHVYRPMRLAL